MRTQTHKTPWSNCEAIKRREIKASDNNFSGIWKEEQSFREGSWALNLSNVKPVKAALQSVMETETYQVRISITEDKEMLRHKQIQYG